ncbi:MAG: hypothetical protein RL011_931, partial [Pseudomonadota bacterium]
MHKKSQRDLQSGAQSSVPGWIDLSTSADGKTRQLCPSRSNDVNDEVQCAFRDSSTGLIWSSRAPGQDGFREAREYLTWSEAKSACEKIGQWSGMDGWRLPTEAELTSAFLTPSGAIRQSGLLGLTDRVSSFGALPKYSLIWSINEDPQNPNQAKALLRGANNISMGTVAKDMARGWHCVHSSAVAIEPKRSLTEPAIPLPLTAIPIEPATKADSQRLPTIRPEAATPGDVKASAILGQSNTSTSAPKWTIRPINDFDRLSFILNVSENPKEAAKPALAKPSSASTDGRDVPSIAEGSTMPPEFPHSIPESTRKTAQSNKAFVKALRKAFTRIGLTHAIDDNGR